MLSSISMMTMHQTLFAAKVFQNHKSLNAYKFTYDKNTTTRMIYVIQNRTSNYANKCFSNVTGLPRAPSLNRASLRGWYTAFTTVSQWRVRHRILLRNGFVRLH